jgi:endoglucanase
MMRKLAVILLMVTLSLPSFAAECRNWAEWDGFKSRFVDGGRVIDRSESGSFTTSEGQSYGLFFALVANDRNAFDQILKWTEANLAGGDLTARLPAWHWGKRPDGTWGIIDPNPASDSDLWIAYSLMEAGRLWKLERYTALGELLANRIFREEVEELPGLGWTLLPAPKGFKPEPGVWRLNPSYPPIQLLQRMAFQLPESAWSQLLAPAADLIVRSAPRGFAPEWIIYKDGSGFLPDPESKGEGSYNAIRVYLWAGMLATDEPLAKTLVERFSPMADAVARTGVPAEKIDTVNAALSESAGPAGFSAAVIPLLASLKRKGPASEQRLRVTAKAPLLLNDNYYDQALTLFGLGWIDGHYKFQRNGMLQLKWKCNASR